MTSPVHAIESVVGRLGDSRSIAAAPCVDGAWGKCECGATMKVALDHYLHTYGRGVCLIQQGRQKPNPLDLL